MKAHIARNQNAGVPLVLGWNLSPADRGKLEGMAPAFGMKVLLVSERTAPCAHIPVLSFSYCFPSGHSLPIGSKLYAHPPERRYSR